MYFEDFKPGQVFETAERSVSQDDIIAFAQIYDPQPFHTNPIAAQDSHFAGLVSSGLMTLALTFRVFYDLGLITQSSLGGWGLDELRWLHPLRPGDRLHAHVHVIACQPSRHGRSRGTVTFNYSGLNHDKVEIISFRTHQLIACRDAAPPKT